MPKLTNVAKKTKFPVDFKITPGMRQVSEIEYGHSHILDFFLPIIREHYIRKNVSDDRWDSAVLRWVKRCSPKSREPQFYNIKQWEAAIEYSKNIRNSEKASVPLPDMKFLAPPTKLPLHIKSECTGRPWQDDLIDGALKK